MLKWKDDYLIGIPEIDEQHKELFKIAGRAYAVLNDDFSMDKYDKIITILEELKEYAIHHFRSEEEYMASIRCKRLFSQKVEHNDFIEKVNNVDLRKIDENQDNYLLGILNFIVEWTSDHILKKDKEIKS
jgi:hemerythrin